MSALATARVGLLHEDVRGFDTNAPLTPATAQAFARAGYQFAARYIWRDHQRPTDLSSGEVEAILGAGLGLSVIQHYAGDGWAPTQNLGTMYGAAAIAAMHQLLLPGAMTVWCDLEGIAPATDPNDVAAYCDAWAEAVLSAGYLPALYVGVGCILGPNALFHTSFQRYGAAYNLNLDQYPAVRGVCMRQRSRTPEDVPPGVSLEFQTETIQADALGGIPTALFPSVLT